MYSKFLSLQKRDDARQFMKFLHPDLGLGKSIRFFFLALKWLELIHYVCVVFGILKHFRLVMDQPVSFSLKICNCCV